MENVKVAFERDSDSLLLLNIPLGNKTELNSITLSAGKKIISWLEASKLLFYFQCVASGDISLIASKYVSLTANTIFGH